MSGGRTTVDATTIADDLLKAQARGEVSVRPTERDPEFDLTAAYAVEAALVRLRRGAGHTTTGVKVGYANKAAWRLLKLDTVVWAHMYDDTVHRAPGNQAVLSLRRLRLPRIEPEIVFTLARPVDKDERDAASVLGAVASYALGFEIVDSPYAEGSVAPADFVAGFGFHAALVVGAPQQVEAGDIPAIVDGLARMTATLTRNGVTVGEGGGRNVLRSPALCLAELAAAVSRRPEAQPLRAGDLVSTGALVDSAPVAAGQSWTATLDGLGLPPLTLQFS